MRTFFIAVLGFLLTVTAYAAPHETQWTPDTADGAVFVYEWDDAVPAEERVHTFKRVEKEHPAFKGQAHAQQYAKSLEENQRKNTAIGAIVAADPELTTDMILFSYDQTRKLRLSGIPANKKSAASAVAKNKVGADKVEID